MKWMHVISEKKDKDARLWATDCLKYGEDLGEISCLHALFSSQASDTGPFEETSLASPLERYDMDSFI